MRFRNNAQHYGAISKVLHWLLALLMIALLVIGWRMVDLSYYDPWYHRALSWHKSLGMLVGLLVTFKLLWRLASPPPRLQTDIKPFERRGAHLAHAVLWVALIVLPVTGYFISSSEGAPIALFDELGSSWQFPALFTVSEALRETAISVHYYLAYACAAVVAVHAGAALKHQFIDQKDTLKRML